MNDYMLKLVKETVTDPNTRRKVVEMANGTSPSFHPLKRSFSIVFVIVASGKMIKDGYKEVKKQF